MRHIYRVWSENWKEREYLQNQARWENNITIDLKGVVCDDVEWVHLAQNRDHWKALVNRQ
jgi:hypothetical protein